VLRAIALQEHPTTSLAEVAASPDQLSDLRAEVASLRDQLTQVTAGAN
jgi:hypothetical protein